MVLTQRDKLRIQSRSFSFTWTFKSLIPQHLIDEVHAHAQNHDVRHFDLRICGASCYRSHPSQNFNPKSLTTLRLNLSSWSKEFLRSDAYHRNLHLYLSGCTALKTLWLEETWFAISSGDVDIFSSLVDLTELHIIGCKIIGKHRRFSVGAPRLERLTIIRNISGLHWEISSRVLRYLRTDLCLSRPIINNLPHCIEEVEIDSHSLVNYINSGVADLLINTIRYLPHAESFTLSKSTLQVLSAFPEIFESRVADFKWKLLKVITKNELPIKDFPEYLPGLAALTKNCSETLKVEFVKDRLSDLHDDILIQILSFLDAKSAAQTCVLSKRWNNNLLIHLHHPDVHLSSKNFRKTSQRFQDFVDMVLTERDKFHQETRSFSFTWTFESKIPQPLLDRIHAYVKYHDVRHFDLSICGCVSPVSFPSRDFISSSLTTLRLNFSNRDQGYVCTGENLRRYLSGCTALKTLWLENILFGISCGDVDLVSSLVDLRELHIIGCYIIKKGGRFLVRAPRLERLTILQNNSESEMKVPNWEFSLCELKYLRTDLWLSGRINTLPRNIKELEIDFLSFTDYRSARHAKWLIKQISCLPHAESVTLSKSTLQVISAFPEIFKSRVRVILPQFQWKVLKVVETNELPIKELPEYRLGLDALTKNCSKTLKVEFLYPSQNFNPKSLTTLRLNLCDWSQRYLRTGVNHRNLHIYLGGCTALKTLWLEKIRFEISSGDVDIFSSLVDLTELHIIGCNIIGKDECFPVGAPRLERLTILQNISGSHWEISSRVLRYLRTDLCLSRPIINNLPHDIEELEIDFPSFEDSTSSYFAKRLINTIGYLPHAESVTLSKSTLQVISAFPEVLKSRVPVTLPDFKGKLLKVIMKNELPIKDFPEYLPGLAALTKKCSETLKVEFVKDRLSDLPDDILIQIFSFLDAKSAAQTCVLSKRWNNNLLIHLHHPDVHLSSKNFGRTSYNFREFVDMVLTQRDKFHQETRSFSFTWAFESKIPQPLLDRIHAYVQYHDVRHFDLSICGCVSPLSFPPQDFISSSLTTLRLNFSNRDKGHVCTDENLRRYLSGCTALKTLWLENILFQISSCDVDLFSSLVDLRELHIIGCNIIEKDGRFLVRAPRLERLSILQINSEPGMEVPDWEISLRVLKYLRTDLWLPGCTIDELPGYYIEELEIDFPSFRDYRSARHAKWLINQISHLPHAKSVTLSKSTLQVISAFPEIFESRKPVELPQFKWKVLKVVTKNELPTKEFPEYRLGLDALMKNCLKTLKVEFV
ncbi:hypothetical protein POM88_052838 [Heracleum sosnowskyi]|uniref:F-box domain-containing protein n=1 Tax=Heracleum sosnowskyi TaxID=360622 RepID=A0AAD8GQ56_9APIA|nr:hypothetical protein POM88_052838 [Heracleum sosnowskyi]